MAITPTPPRPGMRPAPPPKPKKSVGPTIGLIVTSILALVGLGGAGFLFSQQGGLKAENGSHQQAALAAAETLGIAISTNAPTVWGDLWTQVNASISALKGEKERADTRIEEMGDELETAAGLQATLQRAQSDASQSAARVTELTAEVEALKASAANQSKELQAKLAAAQNELDDARAQLSATASANADHAHAMADETADAPAAETATAAAATVADADATADETASEAVVEPAAPAVAGDIRTYEFPEKRSEILKSASYNAKTHVMKLTFMDDQVFTYSDVSDDVFERLTTLPTYETFFRMKIMGAYSVDGDDKGAVRELGKRR